MRMVPVLTDVELITLMRDRHGVGFRIMNEAEAESCVRREGNWLRVTSKIITGFSRYLADGFGGGWLIFVCHLNFVCAVLRQRSGVFTSSPVFWLGHFFSRELQLLLCHPSDTQPFQASRTKSALSSMGRSVSRQQQLH